ncbi:MAG: D-cysteine desulfhydrase family protein [Synergistales bacterium]|nr:D-cysteine desulfhydrase family protein [Synergistales bacterium]
MRNRLPLENRIHLGRLPTPLHELTRLGAELGGPRIFAKRDDLTGMAISGNKIRKLEYVGKQARDGGATVLITCGGVQSNHCRATAAAAALLGMKSHLVLNGEKPSVPEGNNFLDFLFGAACTYEPDAGLLDMEQRMESVAEGYRAKGEVPFVIPLGASDATGVLGYINAMEEMAQQCAHQGIKPDYVLAATGSGGTLAGMAAGLRYSGLAAEAVGMSVAFAASAVREKVDGLVEEVTAQWKIPELKDGHYSVYDGYIGAGYGATTDEQLVFIRRVAELEGIIVDPVYTGKALFGLRGEIRAGRFGPEDTVVFIHTGGAFGLFPYRRQLVDACGG